MSEEEILDYDENIYQKLVRATARAIDIKLGKTTLADLLDGYTKSIILQQRIDKAIEYCKREIGNIIANFDYVDTKDLENILEILGDGNNE